MSDDNEVCERCEGTGYVRFMSYAPEEGEIEWDWIECKCEIGKMRKIQGDFANESNKRNFN
jgi:hypothetical protein